MGVKGLWKLLEPVGRPVTLESLGNKVLAIDANLLLNQSLKGMRDREGNVVPNAHLIGLFHRICKLLFYRIKPVFVFDGGVPNLKKKTLDARKQRRKKASTVSDKTAEKIVKNFLRGKAFEAVTGKKSEVTLRSNSPREPDMFELPPAPRKILAIESSSEEETDGGGSRALQEQLSQQWLETVYQNPSEVNVDSEDFKSLPAELQHELIVEMKEERKWAPTREMPEEAGHFSSFQLQNVLKRGKLNQRLEVLRKEMNDRNTGDVVGMTSQSSLQGDVTVDSRRIVSEDTGHYILIKGSREKSQEGELNEEFPGEGGFFKDNETPEQNQSTKSLKRTIADSAHLAVSEESSSLKVTSPLTEVSKMMSKPVSYSPLVNVGSSDGTWQHFESSDSDSIGEMGDAQLDRESSNHAVLVGTLKEDLQERFNKQSGSTDSTAVVPTVDDSELITSQISQKKRELEELVKKRENSGKVTKISIVSEPCPLSTSEGAKQNIVEIEKDVVNEITQNISTEKSEEDKEQTISLPIIRTDVNEHRNCSQDLQSKGSTLTEESLELILETKCNENLPGNGSPVIEKSPVLVMESDSESEQDQKCTSSEALAGNYNLVSKQYLNGELKVKRSTGGSLDERLVSIEKSVWLKPELGKGTSDVGESVISVVVLDKEEGRMKEDTGESNELPSLQLTAFATEDDSQRSDDDDNDDDDGGGGGGLEAMDAGNMSPGVSAWQGVNLSEDLDGLQGTFEAEQKELRSERARQERMAATVSNEMYSDSQELLRLFGVPFMVSPMEAEAQCAALDILGLTQGSITDDSDIFLFGCSRVYKNFFNQNKHAELYQSESVERNLGLDRAKLVCLAYLTGSDYTEGLQGVGVVGAMEILNEFPGDDIEKLKKFKEWHDIAQKEVKPGQETKVKTKLRSVVLTSGFPSEEVYDAYMKPVVDESTEPFEWAKPDLHSLRYALEKLGWPRSKTDEVLLPVLKQLNKQETQLKLDHFFPVRFQEARKIHSKRVKRVVNRLLRPGEDDKINTDTSSSDEDGTKLRKKKKPTASTKTRQRKQIPDKKNLKHDKNPEDNRSTVSVGERKTGLSLSKSTASSSGARTRAVRTASVRGRARAGTVKGAAVGQVNEDTSSTSDDSSDILGEEKYVESVTAAEQGVQRKVKKQEIGGRKGVAIRGRGKAGVAWTEEPVLNVDSTPFAASKSNCKRDSMGVSESGGTVACETVDRKRRRLGQSVGSGEGREQSVGLGEGRGQSFGMRERRGQSVGSGEGRGQSVGMREGRGQSVGMGEGRGQSVGMGKGRGQSVGMGEGREQSVGMGEGRGQSVGMGEGRGQSVGMGEGKGDLRRRGSESDSSTSDSSAAEGSEIRLFTAVTRNTSRKTRGSKWGRGTKRGSWRGRARRKK